MIWLIEDCFMVLNELYFIPEAECLISYSFSNLEGLKYSPRNLMKLLINLALQIGIEIILFLQ